MKNCPKCNASLSNEEVVCSSCGEALTQGDSMTFDYNALYSNAEGTPEVVVEDQPIVEEPIVEEPIVEVEPIEVPEAEPVVETSEAKKPVEKETKKKKGKALPLDATLELEMPGFMMDKPADAKETEENSEIVEVAEVATEVGIQSEDAVIEETMEEATEVTDKVPAEDEVSAEVTIEEEPLEIGIPPEVVEEQAIAEEPIVQDEPLPIMGEEIVLPPMDNLGMATQEMVMMGEQPITPMTPDMNMGMIDPNMQQMPLMYPDVGIPMEQPAYGNTMDVNSMLPPDLGAVLPTAINPSALPAVPTMDSPMIPGLNNDTNNAVVPALIPSAPSIIPNTPVESKGGGKIPIIIVTVVSLIAIGVMVWFALVIIENDKRVNEEPELAKTAIYTYEGFNMFLPEGLVAEVHDGQFYVSDKEKTWNAIITLYTGSYNTLVSNRSQLVDEDSAFSSFGYNTGEAEEREVGGTRFVIVPVSMGGDDVLVAYARATGTRIFGIIYRNTEQEYNDTSLREIGQLLAAIEDVGISYRMPEGFSKERFQETFKVAE